MSMDIAPQNKEALVGLIKKGIVYEDDFIEMYMKLIRDEGFLEVFPESARAEAKSHLNFLVDESTGHKNILEIIINSLK